MVAAGQRRQPRDVDRSGDGGRRLHPEQLKWLRHALELVAAGERTFELAPQQPVRSLRAHDLAGLSDVPKPDRHVPRLPCQGDAALRRLHNGRPGVQADPRYKFELVPGVELVAERLQSVKQAQGGARGPVGGVLVSYGVAKAP